MTDEVEKPAAAGGSGAAAGVRLALARRARGISLDEIARELHVDEAKVLALEANDFERLGAPVFVQGYLRKYASLVGMPADEILQEFHRLNPAANEPPVVDVRRRRPEEPSRGGWLAGAAAIVVALLLGGWWMAGDTGRPAAPPRPAGADPAEGAGPAGTGPMEDAPADSGPAAPGPAASGFGPASAEPATAPAETAARGAEPAPAAEPAEPAADGGDEMAAAAQAPAAAPPEPVAAAEGQVRLALAFSGDCWTEVTDADGERLYYGLGTAGRRVAVAGTAPLRVLLGDSEQVAVEVDGAPFAIPPGARRGATAQFRVSP